VGFTATLGGETTKVVASEQGQEDDLVAQQRQVMGDVAPHSTRRQVHRAGVGVSKHKGAEARGNNVGIRSANHTDSHGIMLCLGQKYEKGTFRFKKTINFALVILFYFFRNSRGNTPTQS
jgi:hypothetical protein